MGASLMAPTVNPVGGAGPFKTKVPVTLVVPPTTVVELRFNDMIPAGFMVSTVLFVVPRVAITVTTV